MKDDVISSISDRRTENQIQNRPETAAFEPFGPAFSPHQVHRRPRGSREETTLIKDPGSVEHENPRIVQHDGTLVAARSLLHDCLHNC